MSECVWYSTFTVVIYFRSYTWQNVNILKILVIKKNYLYNLKMLYSEFHSWWSWINEALLWVLFILLIKTFWAFKNKTANILNSGGIGLCFSVSTLYHDFTYLTLAWSMFLALSPIFLFFLESIHFYNQNFGVESLPEYSLLLLPYFFSMRKLQDNALAKVQGRMGTNFRSDLHLFICWGRSERRHDQKLEPRAEPKQLEGPHLLPCALECELFAFLLPEAPPKIQLRDRNEVLRLSGLSTWLAPGKAP